MAYGDDHIVTRQNGVGVQQIAHAVNDVLPDLAGQGLAAAQVEVADAGTVLVVAHRAILHEPVHNQGRYAPLLLSRQAVVGKLVAAHLCFSVESVGSLYKRRARRSSLFWLFWRIFWGNFSIDLGKFLDEFGSVCLGCCGAVMTGIYGCCVTARNKGCLNDGLDGCVLC